MTKRLARCASLLALAIAASPALAEDHAAAPAPADHAVPADAGDDYAAPATAPTSSHWSYEGHEGPAFWGELSPSYAACSTGAEQSPINLTAAVAAEAEPVQLYWNSGADWVVTNNGHTIQASSDNGGLMTVAGKDFQLLQFHFHAPSEHAIDGRRSPMEIHFVHKAEDGALAVVGVMVEGGGSNDLFGAVMGSAPSVGGEAPAGRHDAASLLPAATSFFRYQGSLTTPPCTEVVLWTVLDEPIQVADTQIDAFREMYEMNARPLQGVNRRYILAN